MNIRCTWEWSVPEGISRIEGSNISRQGFQVNQSGGSATCVQGANQGTIFRAQGDTWGVQLTRFGLCLILRFLKLG